MAESQRRLAAIMFSDIVGYSKMMGDDEQATLELLRRHNAIQLPIIEAHGGTVLKFIGDAILSSYPSAINAVRCAEVLQRALRETAGGPISVRIGIHIGDVVEQNGDIFGDGVNIAARIQPLAEPGGICVSRTVYDMTRAQADVRMESLGVRSLKNIKEKVEIFRVVLDKAARPARRKPLPWKPVAAACAAVLAALGVWKSGVFARRAPVARDKRFAVFVAPFHGNTADAGSDGQAMKALIEDRLTAKLGPSSDIRIIAGDVPPPATKDDADALGAKVGANIVAWGQIISLGGQEEIQPFLTSVGTSFRETETQPLDIKSSSGDQLALRKDKADRVADLIILSAAWYYGIVDPPRGMQLIRTINPPTMESLVAEGYVRYRQKKWDEAGALFKKAVALDPSSILAWNGLGDVARAHDRYPDAEKYYRKGIASHPDWPNSYYGLGQTFYAERKMDKALWAYKRAVSLAPKDGLAHRSLANLYDELGQYDNAAEEYRVAVENCKWDPGTSLGVLFYYVELLRSGHRDQAAKFAIAQVRKSGLKAPNLWPFHILWFCAGKYPEQSVLDTAEQGPPDSLVTRRLEAYYFLGMQHLLAGGKEQAEAAKARDYFQKVVQLNQYWTVEHLRSEAELAKLSPKS